MTDQKVAIITGGGRGMGAAIARKLSEQGYRLALMSPSDSARILADELGGIGLQGSTANLSDIEALVEAAREAHGRIDAVVNHTGGPPKGDLLDIADDDWHAALDLIILNVVRMCRLVTPLMVEQGGGAYVNITTFSAFEPDLRFPVSSALRAGLGSFTKMFSDRYAAEGIRMNNILPGFIDSLCRNRGISPVRRSRVYHRPEYPRRRWTNAPRLRSGTSAHGVERRLRRPAPGIARPANRLAPFLTIRSASKLLTLARHSCSAWPIGLMPLSFHHFALPEKPMFGEG
jgi:NAD(P)-dependent dehydrogenase (short-subunit alcohol dehydrogenase family)